jgi:hypothetical protein
MKVQTDTKIRLMDRMGNVVQELDGLPVIEIDTCDGHTFEISSWLCNSNIDITDKSGGLVIEPMSGNRVRIHPIPEDIA